MTAGQIGSSGEMRRIAEQCYRRRGRSAIRARCGVSPSNAIDGGARDSALKARNSRISKLSCSAWAGRWDPEADDGRGALVARDREATSLYILPGYEFHVVDALITNFHVPRSTLMMLVSAFSTRENILAAYQHAIDERYRLLSFGDAMFLH